MKNAGPQVDRALIHICLGELYRYIASKHYVRAISLPKKQVKELGRFTLELNRSDTGLVVHGYGHKSLEKYGISEFVDLRFEGMVQRIRN
jgi:hypothetical protein